MALQYPSQPMNSLLRHQSGLETAYEYVRGQLSYEKTVVQLGYIGLTAQTTLAEVHLQQAQWSPGESNYLIDQAEAVLNKRVHSGEQGFDLRATTRLAQLPLVRSLLGNPKFPSREAFIQTHHDMLDAAGVANDHDAHEQREPGRERHLKIGAMAETAVALLLNRFVAVEDLDQEWLPVSSFLAEDLGKTANASGWDINVYIPNRKGRPALGYKIQVKSGPTLLQPHARDIAVVAVSSDLTNAREERVVSPQIIRECREAERRTAPPITVIQSISERTEKLLTILDRTKS